MRVPVHIPVHTAKNEFLFTAYLFLKWLWIWYVVAFEIDLIASKGSWDCQFASGSLWRMIVNCTELFGTLLTVFLWICCIGAPKYIIKLCQSVSLILRPPACIGLECSSTVSSSEAHFILLRQSSVIIKEGNIFQSTSVTVDQHPWSSVCINCSTELLVQNLS